METSLWLQQQLNEITFEHRNKSYGAFPLRRAYHHTMARSMMISIGFFILAFVGFRIYLVNFTNANILAEQIIEKVITLEPTYSVEQPKIKPLPQPKPMAVKSHIPTLPTRIVIDEKTVEPIESPEIVDIPFIDNSTTEVGSANSVDPGPVTGSGQETPGNAEIETNTTVPIYLVDQAPEFPGGNEEMYKYLKKHLSYPQLAKEIRASGTVVVQFMVNATGEIENVTVVRTPSPLFNSISTETIKKMPKWKPGIYKGKPVPVIFTLPLKFELL